MAAELERFVYLLTNRLSDDEKKRQVEEYKKMINNHVYQIKNGAYDENNNLEFEKYAKMLIKISMVSNEYQIFQDMKHCYSEFITKLKSDAAEVAKLSTRDTSVLNPSERLAYLKYWKKQRIETENTRLKRTEDEIFMKHLSDEIDRYNKINSSFQARVDKKHSSVEKRTQVIQSDLIYLIDYLNRSINSKNSQSNQPRN